MTYFYELALLASTPQHAALFNDIAEYTSVLKARSSQPVNNNNNNGNNNNAATVSIVSSHGGPAPKKRKIANGEASAAESALSSGVHADAELQLYVQDASFAIPQRKKLRLELTRGAGPRYLRARNPATSEVEFGVPITKIRELYLYACLLTYLLQAANFGTFTT
jgi:hypothetical protein